MSAEPARKDFNQILIESMKETVEDVLGKDAAQSFFLFLENYQDITLDEIPYRLPTFFSTLNELFGKGGRTLGRVIARKLYAKLSLKFVENPDKELLEYIDDAIKEVG